LVFVKNNTLFYLQDNFYNQQRKQSSVVFYLQPLLNDGSMKNNWQYKIFGVHY